MMLILEKRNYMQFQLAKNKTFDSISHSYIYALLDHKNINTFLINSVKRIYDQLFASLIVDKYVHNCKIYIMGGIKQGYTVSMFLYTLGIEELVVNIYNNLNTN